MTNFKWLVYPGLSDKEKAARAQAFKKTRKRPDGFEYPMTPHLDYHFKKNDSEGEVARKEARRAKYRAARLADLKQEIEDLDAVKELCGYVFKKGVPTEVNFDKLDTGEQRKFNNWVRQGWLKVVDEPSEEQKAVAGAPPVPAVETFDEFEDAAATEVAENEAQEALKEYGVPKLEDLDLKDLRQKAKEAGIPNAGVTGREKLLERLQTRS